MPPVVALIIGIVANGVGVTGAVIGAFSAMTAVMIMITGAQLIMGGIKGMLAGRPSSVSSLANDVANHSVSIRQSAAPRVVIYGEMTLGGILTYAATSGTSSEFLHLVVTWAGHECEAIEDVYFDTYAVPLDGSGHATGKYSGLVFVEHKLGADGEVAFPQLITDTASLGIGAWTANHRQDGCCSSHIRLKWDSTVFANGTPAIRARIRGKKVADPRDPTFSAASSNVALCVRDFMLDRKYGLRCLPAELNDDTFMAAANLADEDVPILGGMVEKRYACNGFFDTSKTPGDVLKGMLSAGAGMMPWIGGQWSIYLGGWREPSLSLGDDDFRASLQLTGKVSRRDLCSGVKGIFVSPTNDWQTSDFPAVVRAAYVADDAGYANAVERGRWANAVAYAVNDAVMSRGYAYVCTSAHTSDAAHQPGLGASWQDVWAVVEEINWKDVEYPFTTSPATAQRLAKIDLEMTRCQIMLAAPCKFTSYKAQPADTVQISHSRFGFANKAFLVMGATPLQDQSMALGVDLVLRETGASVYSWSVAEEQPMSGTTTPTGDDPGLVSSVYITSVTPTPGHVVVHWDPVVDTFVNPGGTIQVQCRDVQIVQMGPYGYQQVYGAWNTFTVAGDQTQATLIFSYIAGVPVELRIRATNSLGVNGPWSSGGFVAV